MRYPGRLIFAAAALLASLVTAAVSQGVVLPCYFVTAVQCQVISAANPLPVNASVSASISGFTAATTGTPISVTSSSTTGTLPAGAVVVATNVGATNAAYCALGATATTSSQYIAPAGGWFQFTVGSATQLSCITSTSTTTVNMTGGGGLPTGTGGGGSGGGSSITTWATGTLGAMANYGTSPGAVLVPGINAFVTNTNANGQATAANSSPVVLPATQVAVGATAATAPTTALEGGGIGRTSEQTAVTNGQLVGAAYDLVGKQIVLPYANPENFVSGVITSAMTGTTSTSLIAAPASGLRNYITQCTFSNSHATVGTDMILQDGSGGTTIYIAPAAPAFGGATISFPTPLRQPTTATALFVANVTTGANTKAACSGYKGA